MQTSLPLPGDVVWIRRRRWRVERARRDRHIVRLDVASRDRRLTFLSPFDRVFTRAHVPPPRRVRPQSALARLAHLLAHAEDARLPSCAVTATAEILPHQLEPVMAMLAGQSRILLADEVGLGKTVQAGLAIAELMRREAAPRVLVLTPAALREQWADELGQRFHLTCVSADRAKIDALTQESAIGDNPWRRPGVWICSADFLKQPQVREALPADPWDLVVIDEAHAVCGDSDRYALCHELASRARRVLLLTATPHNGDAARFARLIALGAIGRSRGPDGADGIAIFRRTRAAIGQQPPRRVRWHSVALSESETRVLAALRAFEGAVTARCRSTDQALLLLSVFRKRALSTMSALGQSITRRLAWLGEGAGDDALDWLQPRLDFEEEHDAVDREERDGLTVESGLGPAQERSWLRRLRALADEASREERKVERVVSLIHRTVEPVVVFTEFRDSLEVIRRRLRFSRPISVLHGGQDAAERRLHLRQFLHGVTSVLLATDVAGQGLNLQSRARWVMSLELPWNPARLEQRIGRVDRISQTRSTHFTLIVARDAAESGLLSHLARRVLTAQRSFSADALGAVMPPEAQVRASLLLESTPPETNVAASARVHICRRWERPARCAARILLRRRALARAWRAPDAAPSGPVKSEGGRAAALVTNGRGSVLVFSVPLFSGEALIERRIVAVSVEGEADDFDRYQALAKPVMARAILRRLAITARFVRAASSAAADRERELLASFDSELALDEVQPGLFDLREAHAAETRLVDQDRLHAASARRVDVPDAAGTVRAGDPTLEVVISRRQ